MNLELIRTNSLDGYVFEDMKQQFPPEEMKTFDEINYMLAGGSYALDLLKKDEDIAGYVLYYKSDFLWIDYVAILRKFQSCGLGSKVLALFFEKYKDLRGCYFEVEKENSADINTVRRVNFYKKNGCELLDFKYYFPNEIKKLEMSLFYKSLSCEIPDTQQILADVNEVFLYLHSKIPSCKETFELITEENLRIN